MSLIAPGTTLVAPTDAQRRPGHLRHDLPLAGGWTAGIDRRILAASGLSGPVHLLPLALVTAVLSNLVSNVPAVMFLKPIVSNLQGSQQAWLAVAAASTFAGNLTPVGSVANLIVIEQARRAGVHIAFGAYLRVGLPLTLATSAVAVALLASGT